VSASACDQCLRTSALIGFLAARLSAVLGGLDGRLGSVLALGEDELIAAVAGRHVDRARRFRADFDAEGARRSLADASVGAVCRHGNAYPRGLLALEDVPPVIYFTGDPERLRSLIDAPAATVVGTRTPSRYGLEVARELGRGLAVAGATVVSGLALGIDAAAHRGVLDAAGAPLAVLAGGVDVPYPKSNRALHERVRREGTLVSELPPGLRPLRWSFPARNRIMAALGRLTVVVEAAESSGSLITAEFAAQLGREVGAVPGTVTARLAAGSNRLLRDGAAVIRSAEDALDELLGVASGPRATPALRGVADTPVPAAPMPAAPVVDAPIRTATPRSRRGASEAPRIRRDASQAPRAAPALEPPLRKVLDLVEGGEAVDAIARATGLTSAGVRAALGRLELLGLVARDGFAGYVRTLAGASPAAPILGEAAATDPPS
jgi:DNA processing protein